MLSLQSTPQAQDLKQQVEAVSRDAEETGAELKATPTCVPEPVEEEEEEVGGVEYYVEYCVDKYALTYKTQVLYPHHTSVA